MQFTVGDKVVHPRYGPGQITAIVSREAAEGPARYYVIDIPRQGLTVHSPVLKAGEAGMRLAMSQTRLSRVLSLLRGSPHRLPADYRQRQDQMWARLKTGGAAQLAGLVRDLTGHRHSAHLTQKDAEYLQQGRDLLAAEVALVSGMAFSDASRQIEAALAAAARISN